jgi:hypothetical protein
MNKSRNAKVNAKNTPVKVTINEFKTNAKKGGKGKRQNNHNMAPRVPKKDVYTAPSNTSTTFRSVSVPTVRGTPQQDTDIGTCPDSVRVVGDDLISNAIASDGSHNYGFGATGSFLNIAPGDISTRLQNYEEMYQYYAIRELTLLYTNDVGSTTAGSVAIGILQSTSDNTSETINTQQLCLELKPAFKTAVWETERLTYRFNGKRLYNTDTSISVSDFKYQIQIYAILNSASLSAATFGTLRVSYVIDFYKQTPITANPSLRIAKYLAKYKVPLETLIDTYNKMYPIKETDEKEYVKPILTVSSTRRFF